MKTFKTGWAAIGFKSYQDYLYSDMWQEKQKIFLSKYPFCKDCGRKATIVHHTNYERVPQEKESDLRALCFRCHQKRHNK